ncbi:MAG: hypothetical protein HY236_15335 [Acidobacteria bacterium]|nr:hypothetical protein [Acidobacteriota bacterium]
MKISGCSLLVLLGLGGAGAAFGQDSGANKANGAVSYFRDIRPIIQRQCQGCHQPAVKQGGLDLTRYEGFKAGGNGGSAFEPGAPEKSLVLSYIKGERTPRMPFGLPPLAPEQIDLFSRWISADGSDDTPAEARETVATDKPPVYHLPPVRGPANWSAR